MHMCFLSENMTQEPTTTPSNQPERDSRTFAIFSKINTYRRIDIPATRPNMNIYSMYTVLINFIHVCINVFKMINKCIPMLTVIRIVNKNNLLLFGIKDTHQ